MAEEEILQNGETGMGHIVYRRADLKRYFSLEECQVDQMKDKRYLGPNTPEARKNVVSWCGHCASGEELHDEA